tara:strand:- start:38 stop:520 length:483 start_codon:yes stop_codon:yes gene_type:complete
MDIKGYENYTISEEGEVYNKKYERYLKHSNNGKGYLFVNLCKDGKKKQYYIHRLIALHYIEKPEDKLEVDHIDRDKTNNSVNNLRWATKAEQARNRNAYSNTGYKYISKTTINGCDYYNVVKTKVFNYNLRCDKWTLEEAVEIRDCLCRRHDVPLLDWID